MMKKYILSIFFLIPIWISAQITDSVHIDRSNLVFIKDHGFDRIQYGHDYINEWGHPELPVILKSYIVPINADNFSVQINVDNLKQLNDTYLIYPVQKPQRSDNSDPENFIMPDSTIYTSDFLYPSKLLEIVSNQIIQGYRIITLAVYPLSYKPLKKELYVRNLSYIINYNLGSTPIDPDTKISLNRFNAAKEFVKSIVCNPKDVEQYSHNLQVVISPTNLNGSEHESKLKTLSNVTKEIVPDYVIITNRQLERAFQLLANWKIKKGIPTIIKTIEEIQEEYIGSDLPQKVKNYLKDIRNRWSTNSLFVLLGGDMDVIPSRYVTGSGGPQVTDAYFLCDDYEWTPLNLEQPS